MSLYLASICKIMQKLAILTGIIAIAIILVIPAIASSQHLAKASTCSSSHASPPSGASNAGPVTGTGSCSASAAAGPGSLSAALSLNHKSGCTSTSVAHNFFSLDSQDSNTGGLSCTSHSP
jgi:uncharacterized membrane protein